MNISAGKGLVDTAGYNRLPKRVLRAGTPLALLLLTSGCNRGILDPVGPVAAQEKQLLINSTAIMLAIIIPTMIATVAVAWWFRRGNRKATYLPDWEYSGAIEMVVWGIPILTIMLLGGIAWIGSHDLDPAKPLRSSVPPVRVEVVSLDWKWLFIYPDQGIATVNQLVVPAGAPINFRLTSGTVWNVFWVPQMGTMIYTMPRMTTRLNLEADRPGSFKGLSGHFSGDGFPGMQFEVKSVPPAQFAAWAHGSRGAGPVLDRASFDQLQKPSSYVRPYTYGSVVPNMFDYIVAGKEPPPISPRTAPPSQHVSPQPPLGHANVR